MFSDIIVSYLFNTILFETKYHSLINCIFVTFCSFLKLIFYENEFIENLLYTSILNSTCYYILDTFNILSTSLRPRSTMV